MTNLSTCCGAEIATFWRGGGWFDRCLKCEKETVSPDPQPKGEGWRERFQDFMSEWGPDWSEWGYDDEQKDMELKAFIQSAIDEAVEAERREILKEHVRPWHLPNGMLFDPLTRKIINPSPNDQTT